MKVSKSKEIVPYIPTASMADIAFLLIIFFMVASVFPIDKTQMDLPATHSQERYQEDSAVIAVTTNELENIRGDVEERSLSDITARNERVIVRASNGVSESSEYYRQRSQGLNINSGEEFNNLKTAISRLVREVERRRQIEGRNIIIVIKADAKVPYYAVSGVVQALQEIGGEVSTSIAILSNLED